MSGYQKWPSAEKINWDNVDASRTFGVLPRWLYCGEIVESKAGLTKGDPQKNKPQLPKVACTIQLTASYDNLVDVGRRKMFSHLTFSERAAFRPKQLCEALGCDPPRTTSEEDLSEFAEAILGETVWMILGERLYNEKNQNEIEAFISEAELEDAAASLEPPGEAEPKASKSKGRRSRDADNGASGARRGARATVPEMDTEDEIDEDQDHNAADGVEEEEPVAVEPRRRGRPPKERSVRR